MSITNAVAAKTAANSVAQPNPMTTASIQAKFMQAGKEMTAYLIERPEEIKIMLTAMVCRENAFLAGLPGTAKSMTARLVAQFLAVPAGGYFEWQLNRFTEIDELFGPYDLMVLKQTGSYVRRTANKLPQAVIAYLDEYFNASSAVINSLNLVMNERVFDDGSGMKPLPLRFVVAAANLFPSAASGHDNCEAAFDRFLFRRKVNTIQSQAGQDRLLWDKTIRQPLKFSVTLTLAELETAQREVLDIPWRPEAREALKRILAAVRQEGGQNIVDRRILKATTAVQAFAYISGKSEVHQEHLEILQHIFWMVPEASEKVAKIVLKIANPIKEILENLLAEADEISQTVDFSSSGAVIRSWEPCRNKLEEIGKKLRAMAPDKSKRPADIQAAIDITNKIGLDLLNRVTAASASAKKPTFGE